MKYMWLNQNETQSSRLIHNRNKTSLGNANNKNLRESNQSSKSTKKIKRFRSNFTTHQINYLEEEFRKFPYIDTSHRKEVAATLNISERGVKIWFQNRRMKEKKEMNMRDHDDEKSGRIIIVSAEEKTHIVNAVQTPIGTKLDSLPLITNSVDCSKDINCNIHKLKQDVNRKVNNIIRDLPSKYRVNMSKVNMVPKFTLYQKNQSNTISSDQRLSASVKINNNNANERLMEQSSPQPKKYKLTSYNKSNEVISKYFIPKNLSGDRQKVSPQKMFCNGEDSDLSKKIKRFRSAFTTDQTNSLERVFKNVQYIGNTQRKELADALNISESAVKIWFQNRRMKEKKEPSMQEYKEHTNRKILEFPKEQLTVLNNVQSTNEQASCSMPLLETCVDNVINSNNDSNLKYQINNTNVKNDVKGNSENNDSLPLKKNNKLFNNMYKPVVNTDIKQQEPSFLKDIHPKCYQDMPQDLSLKKQKSSQTQKSELKLTNICPNTAYIPQGGIFWKPINIVPVVSADSSTSCPVNISSDLPLIQEQNSHKVKCNCDCHVKVLSNPTILQQNSANPHIFFTTLPISSYIQTPSFKANI